MWLRISSLLRLAAMSSLWEAMSTPYQHGCMTGGLGWHRLAGVEAVRVCHHDFAGLDLAGDGRADGVHRAGLGGDDPPVRADAADAEGADAMAVSHADDVLAAEDREGVGAQHFGHGG